VKKIGKEVLFLKPAKGNPRNSEGSFIKLKDGGIMFAYSKFVGEDWYDHSDATINAVFSYDNGETWSEDRTIIKKSDGDKNLMSVSLLRMGNGDIGLFYCRKSGVVDCRSHLIRSSDEGKTWSEPVCCVTKSGYFVTNNDRVVRLKNGRIIVPANFHKGDTFNTISERATSHFFISDDDGFTWREAKTYCEVPFPLSSTGLQETGLIELDDGTIWAWSRTNHGSQFVYYSYDFGDTWTIPSPSEYFTSPCSPMSVKKIENLNKIMSVFNPIPNYLGRKRDTTWGRTPLICAFSEDGGKTFTKTFTLEDDDNIGYCYIAIYSDDDYILLSYCHGGDTEDPLTGTKILKIKFDEIL
jgi:sialidase-1